MQKRQLFLLTLIASVFLLFYGATYSLAQFVSEEDILKFSLFDIQLTIPDDFKIIHPGDELLASVKLVNLGSSGRIDVFLDYWVTDFEQSILLQNKETVAVETQAGFVRVFNIPENAEPGKYTLYAKLTYANGKEAVANSSFEILENKTNSLIYYSIAALIILTILIYVVFKSKPIIERLKVRKKVSMIVKNRLTEN